jgi:predicted MFS family arabinose efflux permease
MPLALLALTISAFAIGTTEFVIVGLIPTIADNLHVGLPSAGLLVSLYALAVAVGAPVLTALTGKVPRKPLLVALMALFTLGNLIAWWAPGYGALIAARVLTGLAHGVFFSVGSIIATSLVPREKAARAIATMFSGMTVAFVTGIPLGTFVGQHFGWRATFLIVAGFGVVALAGALLFVPRHIEHAPPAPLARQLRVLVEPRLLLVYAMTAARSSRSPISRRSSSRCRVSARRLSASCCCSTASRSRSAMSGAAGSPTRAAPSPRSS